jgi:spoIIIJ-associated protein
VEWVETTGRTVEDAKESALDELGVDESDAEFEVVQEARAGLFGRLRSEARVRARVRPTAPRAKEDRRDRRRRNRGAADDKNGSDSGGAAVDRRDPGSEQTATAAAAATAQTPGAPKAAPDRVARSASEELALAASAESTAAAGPAEPPGDGDKPSGNRRGGRGQDAEGRPSSGRSRQRASSDNERPEGADMEVALDEQGRIGEEFLQQLLGEFGLSAAIRVVRPDDDTVDLQLEGSDLGLLIGPKGSTLLALQDLTRTVVHHQTGAGNGRLHVDVGGYRQKRSEALARFAEQVATTVKETGSRTVLEPMPAADRKVVHDAITGIEGVSTISEGEEPQRRVVVLPGDH